MSVSIDLKYKDKRTGETIGACCYPSIFPQESKREILPVFDIVDHNSQGRLSKKLRLNRIIYTVSEEDSDNCQTSPLPYSVT